MFKVIAFLIVAIVIVMAVPPLRAKVMPVLEPTLTKIGLGDRIANPVRKRTALNEIDVLIQKLEEDIAEKKRLPTPRDFPKWVRANTRLPKRGIDPWGSPYYFVNNRQNVTVGSNGPDLTRDSEDDVKKSVPLN